MTTSILFLIGRIILGIYWLGVAYNHFKNSGMLAGYAASKGVKSTKTAVIGSGILALLGGLSILFGIWPRIGIALLIIFLVGVTFKIHTYWKLTDPHAKMSDQIQFQKNFAIIGALFIMFIITLPWVWSL